MECQVGESTPAALRLPGGAGTPSPRTLDPTRARLAGHEAVAPPAPPRWGGEGGAGVKGQVSGPSGLQGTFSNSPKKMHTHTHTKSPSLHISGLWFCFSYFEGGGQKSKTFYIRMSPHTQSRQVFLLQGALEKPPVLLSAWSRRRIMKPKTFIL